MAEDNSVGVCGILEQFVEVLEVEGLIRELPTYCSNPNELEFQKERFCKVLDYYQEQPHLIDPHLSSLLEKLVEQILNPEENEDLIHASASFATHIIKVRGFKVVVRHLPHEVKYMEAVLQLLEKQKNSQNWETRYVLVLWLSILVLIPFHLSRFDSNEKGDTEAKTLMQRILKAIQLNLAFGDKSQDAVAFLSAKFLTRPEIVQKFWPEFLDWALQVISQESSDRMHDLKKIGALKAVCAIYKHGKREDLLKHAPTVLKIVQDSKLNEDTNVVIQKLAVKLMQRLGLTFLKAKVASWRYQRGSRSLALNLDTSKVEAKKEEECEDEADEDYDVPDEIEEVIEYLLESLRSTETIIRWSGAKGIGRVTARLPKELADEVVESLLQLLSLKESDSAWHGGCLSLAELARRGLLLPKRLDEVVNVVLKALVYDERRGCFSVGAHVRDAACYVCWAFARAYSPEVMMPYIPSKIAPALLVTSVFDREVNCRRAASAAFQESVGRLGAEAVPHGIDLLTTCDYHSVGIRAHTYTDLSVKVAEKSPEYAVKLVEHLLEKKICHWDNSVRELTGQALRNLVPQTLKFMLDIVIPTLLDNIDESKDLYTRHGSLVAIGAIIGGIAEIKNLKDVIDVKTLERIASILAKMEQRMELRGSAGELMRSAVTPYIQNLSEAKFPAHDKADILDLWKMIIDENLVHKDPSVQERAISAVPAFVNEYFSGQDTLESLIQHFISQLDNSELHRRGFALAIGSLPANVLKGRLDKILPTLIDKTLITKNTEVWAEGRRDVIKSIINITKTVGVSEENRGEDHICEANIVPIYDCFMKALEDYTHDRRGDIGAWVREAAMSGLSTLTLSLASKNPKLVPQVCIEAMMPKIGQQALEKIDRTRGHAALIFATLLLTETVPYIPHRTEVIGFFPSKIQKLGTENFEAFGWSVESETFPIFSKLLRLPGYAEFALLGLIISVGGVTERLVRQSSLCLFKELESMDELQMQKFGQILLKIFGQFSKNDRITLPLLKCLDQLLNSGQLMSLLSTEFAFDIFTLVKTEITKCGEPNKLVSSIDVFCGLLQSEHKLTVSKCLVQLSIFLCHKFPRIRKVTASKLFETLIMYDEVIEDEDNKEEVNAILSDTNWDKSVEEIRPIRNRLCELCGVQAPALIKKQL